MSLVLCDIAFYQTQAWPLREIKLWYRAADCCQSSVGLKARMTFTFYILQDSVNPLKGNL